MENKNVLSVTIQSHKNLNLTIFDAASDVVRDKHVRIPTFSGPKYHILNQYSKDAELAELFSLCNEFFNLACFAKMRYLYLCKILNAIPDKSTLFFPLVLQSLCCSLIMDVARLYDKKGWSVDDIVYKTDTVCERYDSAQHTAFLDIGSEICSARSILSNRTFRRLRGNLKTLRDKIYAHNDKDCRFEYGELLFLHNLELYDLSKMADLVGHMCRTILATLSVESIPSWDDDVFDKFTSDISISVRYKEGQNHDPK